jgi:hypothetical protein
MDGWARRGLLFLCGLMFKQVQYVLYTGVFYFITRLLKNTGAFRRTQFEGWLQEK